MKKIFTFWEGKMPDYLKLCMKTWSFDYVVLTFDTINKYTDLKVDDNLKSFTLPQISDAIRAHVLRDNIDSYWLDTDTIVCKNGLIKENIIGWQNTRAHSTGISHSTIESRDFFEKWAEYQDRTIQNKNHPTCWNVLVNMFTDTYVPYHDEIKIYDIELCRPELYMIKYGSSNQKYVDFYFNNSYTISDIKDETSVITLHNSWTPQWYKNLSEDEVLSKNYTLSNFLREILKL